MHRLSACCEIYNASAAFDIFRFDGDSYIQHNTGIADGLSGLGAAWTALAEQGIQMIYDKTYMVLADGNYGLSVSEGTFGGAHFAF